MRRAVRGVAVFVWICFTFSGNALARPLPSLWLTFIGGAGKVGGSCFMLEDDGARVLLDCGSAFDPEDEEVGGGRTPHFAFDPKSISAVLLSHVHLDHAGEIPRLVKDGFRGKVHATRVTCELAAIVMKGALTYGDFGQETFYASARGSRKKTTVHSLADCPYGRKISERRKVTATRGALADGGKRLCSTCVNMELEQVMAHFEPHPYHVPFLVMPGMTAVFQSTGHIPGSAMTTVSVGTFRVAWSGDYGGGNNPLLKPPETLEQANVALLESTYGSNTSPETDPVPELVAQVEREVAMGRRVLIPAFTLDRTQRVLAALAGARRDGRLHDVPVYVTSPTADGLTKAYIAFSRDRAAYGESFSEAFFGQPFRGLTWSRPRGKIPAAPSITVASSADGRFAACKTLLPQFVVDPQAAVVKVGWAPPSSPVGRLYDAQKRRAATVALDPKGEAMPLRANLSSVSLSAHGHASSVARAVVGCRDLQRVFLVHGEPDGLAAFAAYLRRLLGGKVEVRVPAAGGRVKLL